MRAPFQVLVYPYRFTASGQVEYALLQRVDNGFWQAVAGGGEDQETPLQAARREAFEEAGLPLNAAFIQLDTVEPIPISEFKERRLWSPDLYVIPQYCFGATCPGISITLSEEHSQYRWAGYEQALKLIKYHGNKTALWELDQRLKRTKRSEK